MAHEHERLVYRVSHLLEQMHVAAAHRERLVAPGELDDPAPRQGTTDAGDEADIHNGAAVDLPERARVQFPGQFLDRFADQGFALTGDDFGVFIGRLEINDIIHGDQPDAVPLLDPQILNPLRALLYREIG